MSDRKLTEINIKYCIYYYLNDLININDLDFEKIVLNKKLHEDIFIYWFRHKLPSGTKPFYIIFHEIHGYNKGFERSKYVILIP